MKLYLLERTDDWWYDTYDSFVVCANSIEDAVTIFPIVDSTFHEWVTDISLITCKEIWEANSEQERWVILWSYNAW